MIHQWTKTYRYGSWVLLLILLTSCVAPMPAGVAEAPAEGAKIILRVGTGDSGEGLTPHNAIISAFEAANPDIQVHLEPVGSGDYYARILTQIAAKDAPDILQIGDDAVPMFASKGAFLDLDPWLKGKFPLDLNIYLPGVVTPGAYAGKQYLLPKDF